MKLLKLKTDIAFFLILAVLFVIAAWQLHFFNINFELENVNKWNNSQIMMSYASKLRKVLLKFNSSYYYNTLFLGYF